MLKAQNVLFPWPSFPHRYFMSLAGVLSPHPPLSRRLSSIGELPRAHPPDGQLPSNRRMSRQISTFVRAPGSVPMKSYCIAAAFTLAASACLPAAALADDCANRGQLDEAYCDTDKDLVADIPAKTRDPSVIVFAYTPVEDPAVYENAFKPFTEYLGKCMDKRVVYYPVQSNSAEIEAMRSGRLTVAGFSTGPVGFAVNMAGAVPFAAKGTEKGVEGYNLIVVVKAP